jgi:hypothetical protein
MTIPQSVLDTLPADVRAAVLAAQAATVTAAPTAAPQAAPLVPGIPEIDGWTPDFNAARATGTFSEEDRPNWIEWQDVFKATFELLLVKNVTGRKGTFYVAEFKVLESNSDKYKPGARLQKSFHYFARPRCEDEKIKNSRSFRELGDLAAAAYGQRSTRDFDANWHIGELLTKSVQGPLGLAVEYEQAPYTSKLGKSGVGSDFRPVAGAN